MLIFWRTSFIVKCSVYPITFADILPRLFLTARCEQLGGAWNELLLTYTIVWKSSQVAWGSLETRLNIGCLRELGNTAKYRLPAPFVSFQLWKQPVTLLEQVHVCQYCITHVAHPMKLIKLTSLPIAPGTSRAAWQGRRTLSQAQTHS